MFDLQTYRGDLTSRLNTVFDDFFSSLFPETKSTVLAFNSGYPKINASEIDNRLVLEASLPGLSKEDVSVNYNSNTGVLTISGKTKNSKEDKKTNYYIRELRQSSFHRSFQLPSNIDAEKCQASLQNGILKLEFNKSTNTKSSVQHITIQ